MRNVILMLVGACLAKAQYPPPSGGSGGTIGGGGGGSSVVSPSLNGAAYWNGTSLTTTATGGAGTLCLTSVGGVAPTWSGCPGTGGGTVTSVGMTVPAWLAVAGSPITSSGTLAVTPATGQQANVFLATPNGSAGAVGLRAIVPGDLAGGVNASATTCFFGDNAWKTCGGGGGTPGGTTGQIQYNNAGMFGGFTPGGDVTFAQPNYTVTGLQGRPVSSTAPTANQMLAWNGSVWIPTTPAAGGTGGTSAYTLVTFSATPTFTVVASTSVQNFRINLTGNVTGSTLGVGQATAGQDIAWIICQDATGGRTFTWPPSVPSHMVIDSTANACSRQAFRWDGTAAQMIAPGLSDGATPGLITSTGILTLPTAPDTLVGRASVDTMTGSKTWIGTTDASGAAHTIPSKVGTIAARPAACTVGEQYFATDGTAGQNLYFCTTANTWTLMSGGGGGRPTYLPYVTAAACEQLGVPSGNIGLHFGPSFTAVILLTSTGSAYCGGAPAQSDPPTGLSWPGPAIVIYPSGYAEGQFSIGPMPGWTSGHRVDVNLYWSYNTADGSNTAWRLAFGCNHLGAADVFSNFQTLNGTAVAGGANFGHIATLTGLTVPPACTATDYFLLRVARQVGANGDTSSGSSQAFLIGEQLLWN